MDNNFTYLKQIRDFILTIEEYVQGYDLVDFKEDKKTQDAVIRNVELIGEAIRRIDPIFANSYPQLPIKEAIETRNRLIHEYDDIDLGIVWNTITKDLSKLRIFIEDLV